MKIGFIGLGRMGKNMVLNLLDHKHKVVVYNRSAGKTNEIKKYGVICSYSVEELIKKLPKQKIIWLMIKSGKPVDIVIKNMLPYLKKGDIIIDGGNSYFKDSIRRYSYLKRKGINFLDCGTSGGISGARHGACMMIGGDKTVFKKAEILFRDMSVKDGYGYMGKAGAGHFVKMVHNGIEYGMMASIAEGFEAIKKYSKKFGTDLKKTAKVYSHGSIIESRLVDWMLVGMKDKKFKSTCGIVPKGETEEEMKKLEKLAEMVILNKARLMRVKTRKKPTYAGKLLATMRNQFGGHEVRK